MKQLLYTIPFLLMGAAAQAQSVGPELLSSAGQDADGPTFNVGGTDYKITWSIGEPIIGTESFGTGSERMEQGYQQASHSIIFTEVMEGSAKLLIQLSVYPNPTAQSVTLTKAEGAGMMTATVRSMKGTETLMQKQLAGLQETLDFSALAVGTYLITITDAAQGQQTFKVVKK